MKRAIFKSIGLIILFYLTICFLTPFSGYLSERSNKNLINYLAGCQERNVDRDMQAQFPEGYVFFNAIFCLALLEYSAENKDKQVYCRELVENTLQRLFSEEAKSSFDSSLHIEYGAFYNGWLNYTLRKYLESEISTLSANRNEYSTKYKYFTQKILAAQEDSIYIIDSYENANWPADNLVCISSLPDSCKKLKRAWLNHIIDKSEGDLIHHVGFDLSKARGCSSSLALYLISEFNSTMAKEMNLTYQQKFRDQILGIEFIKEDLDNTAFQDFDSGPVIAGYGSVSTVVNVKAQRSFGRDLKITRGFLNVLGLPCNFGRRKFYLFQQEPMYDVFMLWINV